MFQPRSREQIRDQFLQALRTRYAAHGLTIITNQGSDAFIFAESLALQFESIEQQAFNNTKQVLPDLADPIVLARHAEVDGVDRRPANAAQFLVEINGTPNGSTTFATRTLVAPDGQRFAPTATGATFDGDGHATINVQAQTLGTDGNKTVGTLLTWSSTPVNCTSLATITAIIEIAENEESDEVLAQRVIAQRQERPASGNRADLKNWCESFVGVGKAYVYPLTKPVVHIYELGCATCLVLKDPPTAEQVYNPVAISRVIPPNICGFLKDYILGLRNSEGELVTNGTRLLPVTVNEDDFEFTSATEVVTNVTIEVLNNSTNAFPWSGTFTIESSTTTQVVINANATALAGKSCAFFVDIDNIRGGYQVVTVLDAQFDTPSAGKTTLTFVDDFAFAAAPTGTIYPACPNDDAIRRGVFAYFDALGPGDISPTMTNAEHCKRWPAENMEARATLYKNALEASTFVTGVIDANLVTPASDQVPNFGELFILGTLLILEA